MNWLLDFSKPPLKGCVTLGKPPAPIVDVAAVPVATGEVSLSDRVKVKDWLFGAATASVAPDKE